MASLTPLTVDYNGGLTGTNAQGTYKSLTTTNTLSWNAQNVQSCQIVFGLMQSDMVRAFDFEMPGIAERVSRDWKDLVSRMERMGSIGATIVRDLNLQADWVLQRGYERLGIKLPASSITNTPETVQQPGVIYTPPAQTIPAEMLEPPMPPAPTGGVTATPGTAAPGRTTTFDVVQEQPVSMPSGPGGGIVHAEPAATGIPWKWIALGLGALYLLKRK